MASSFAMFILFRVTTDLHVPTFSTFAASMVTRNFTVFRHVTCLIASPTFALPWLLALRSFIALTSVFPGTIHSFFAYENQGILMVIGAHDFQKSGQTKVFFALEFALQFLIRDMRNHNISHLVIFFFAIVTVFR